LLLARGMRFVELEEARTAPGLRLVIADGIPSPWSQGAMWLFDMKGIEYVAVRFRPVAEQVRAWTGSHNVPVVVFEQEPPRTGWAEILALAERLGGRVALVPAEDEERVKLFGLAHEILGEGGLVWSVRLLLVHASFTTEGREGWPERVAQRLAPKYGYAADRVERARARAIAVLRLLARTLEASLARGGQYLLGAQPTALDVYTAVTLAALLPLPHTDCPMLAPVRHAFETLDPAVRAAIAPCLIEHRTMMFQRHLPLPMQV
jgi:glutathione S-transferase